MCVDMEKKGEDWKEEEDMEKKDSCDMSGEQGRTPCGITVEKVRI